MHQPRVSIIYLCHGNERHLPKVVEAFEALTYPKELLTIYFIPNASPDGITKKIREDVLPRSEKDLPKCILIDNGLNEGFAHGNNQGIVRAIEAGDDYVYLNNGDLFLDARAIDEMVKLAESDKKIAAIQSMVYFWHEPEKVNTTGGMVHAAGYGYARDNGDSRADVHVEQGEEIAYASGASVLYRLSALEKVGLLEEGFFMYHEDLELGWRLKIAGYKNVLCTSAWAYHDYKFSRNPMMFSWIELYRWVVLLSYLKLGTMIVFAPLWLAIEMGSWVLALRSKTLKAKWWALKEVFTHKTWDLWRSMRHRAQVLRRVDDRELLQFMTGRIDNQEVDSIAMRMINPIVDMCFRITRFFVRW